MELKRKKELLLLADSIAKDINNQGCGNYVPKILNSISIAKKDKQIDKLPNILNKMKYTDFGGANQKNGYKQFVDEIFKNSKYRLMEIDFDELTFIFSWVRRIINEKTKNKDNVNKSKNYKNDGKGPYMNNQRSFKKNVKGNYQEDLNNNPFSKLADYKFK